MHIEDIPALSIRAHAGGGFSLRLRHSGFNWIAYQIDDRVAAGLSNVVRKHVGDGPASDLIKSDPIGRHWFQDHEHPYSSACTARVSLAAGMPAKQLTI